MTKPINGDIGELPRSALLSVLPDSIPMRRGKNGFLYLVSPWGAWYLNGGHGQDFLLENGTVWGPGQGPAPAQPLVTAGAAPESPGDVAPAPAPAAPPADGRRKRGFLDLIGQFD